MPAANPLADSTMAAAGTLSSSQPAGHRPGGSANLAVAGLVAGSLFVLVALHLMGFRFAFDVSVGRR